MTPAPAQTVWTRPCSWWLPASDVELEKPGAWTFGWTLADEDDGGSQQLRGTGGQQLANSECVRIDGSVSRFERKCTGSMLNQAAGKCRRTRSC